MRNARFGLWLAAAFASGSVAMGCESSSSSSSGDTPPMNDPFDAGGGTPDSGDPPVASECTAPTAGPTKHQGDIGDETWTAAGSPHLLPYDLNIVGKLTLEPCAEVLLAKGLTVSVRGGSIVANGTATKRVHIGAQDAANPFVMIRTLSGSLHFAYTTIDGGGDPSNIQPDLTGTLNLQGLDQTLPSQETLFVDHVRVMGSKTNGIVLRDGAGFAKGSTALTVSGSAQYPVSMWSRATDNLPDGAYTGSTHDERTCGSVHHQHDHFGQRLLRHRSRLAEGQSHRFPSHQHVHQRAELQTELPQGQERGLPGDACVPDVT